jgi:hypothetical protein
MPRLPDPVVYALVGLFALGGITVLVALFPCGVRLRRKKGPDEFELYQEPPKFSFGMLVVLLLPLLIPIGLLVYLYWGGQLKTEEQQVHQAAPLVSVRPSPQEAFDDGKPTNVFLALLLGIIIYVLLDVSTFFTTFHGVSLDARVLRGKAAHWGGVSLLVGLAGLTIALFAGLLAHPLSHPLLRQALGVLSTVIAIGAVLGALRVWRTRVSDVLRSPDD